MRNACTRCRQPRYVCRVASHSSSPRAAGAPPCGMPLSCLAVFFRGVTRANAQAICGGQCSCWSVLWACIRTQGTTRSCGRLGALVGLSACNDIIIRWKPITLNITPDMAALYRGSISWLYRGSLPYATSSSLTPRLYLAALYPTLLHHTQVRMRYARERHRRNNAQVSVAGLRCLPVGLDAGRGGTIGAETTAGLWWISSSLAACGDAVALMLLCMCVCVCVCV